MREYIITYTGRRFYAADPTPESIDIRDIAHGLSNLCRGNGQVKTFFSVAQHSILCAREAAARQLSPRLVLACLLHDGSEAYMADVPRPYKQFLPGYRAQENRLLQVIYEKYLGTALTEEEQRLVKEIDDALLWYDLRDLLHESQEGEKPTVHIPITHAVEPFGEVEHEYLALFEEWKRKIAP